MPLKWCRGENPYRDHYFSILGVGPDTPHQQIAARAGQLVQLAQAGRAVDIHRRPLEVSRITEARTRLLEASSRASELLLVHAEHKLDTSTLERLRNRIRSAVTAQEESEQGGLEPPPLRHPLARLWLLPEPDADVVSLPGPEELGLVRPTDPEDLELDILFDS